LHAHLALLLLAGASAAPQQVTDALDLEALPDDEAVAALLWQHAPALAEARSQLGAARSDVIRSHLFPNPSLDLGADGFVLGTSNPPGLSSPAQTGVYSASVGQLVEIGKRGPRQDAATAAEHATLLQVRATLRGLTYDLLEQAGAIAASQLRVAELEGLAADAARLTALQRARTEHGDAAGLDADRASLEQAQIEEQLAGERIALSQAVLDCARIAGVGCRPFTTRDVAAAFLSARIGRPVEASAIERRPDVLAWEAQARSASSLLTLAHRAWIPDPTLHAGFTYSHFTISGDNPRTAGLGVSIPITLFEHGQAEGAEATSRLAAAELARTGIVRQAQRDVETLRREREELEQRRTRLRGETLPRAEDLVHRMESSMKAGGVALQDLLLARRTYGQLLLEGADLDLTAFRLSLELERAGAEGPSGPTDLVPRS
jgi:cobalt-zinc-cadmium efflux system outer membrane protein